MRKSKHTLSLEARARSEAALMASVILNVLHGDYVAAQGECACKRAEVKRAISPAVFAAARRPR